MLRFCPLASGSSGNCVYAAWGETHLLVDAGISGKRIEAALEGIVNPAALQGVLVTHEHSDHALGVGVLSRRYGLPVFATPATWQHFRRQGTIGAVAPDLQRSLTPGQALRIGDLEILPFALPHDAAQPVGYRLSAQGRTALVATDMGYATDTVRQLLREADVVLLECNHDVDMLQNGPYPRALKERITGSYGHLSNVAAGVLLAEVASERLQHVFLGHLSAENNHPLLALETVQRILDTNEAAIPSLAVAERHGPSAMVEIQ